VAISTRIDPIARDISTIVDEELSPAAQTRHLVRFAREELIEAQQINRQALGVLPDHETFVDGRQVGSVEAARIGSVIMFEFDLLKPVFAWVDRMLIMHSPVRSGRYRSSHILLADGIEVDVDGPLPPAAREFVFLNTQSYARRIEKGLSQQAEDGVYHVVAELAQGRFGNIARITFEYRRLAAAARGGSDDRQPAIVITLG
jgi:hypothetical protein